jgi:hypothetical protein
LRGLFPASEGLGRGVGRQKGLEVQLGQGDVDGGRERRQVGDEAQLAVVAGQAQRHGEPEVIGAGADRGYIALQLGDEIVEAGIETAQRLVTQVLDDVATPLREVLHPPAHAVGVDRQTQHVHRRLQQFGRSALGEHRQGRVGGNDLPIGPATSAG